MKQVVCHGKFLEELVSNIKLFAQEGYFIVEGSFQVLNNKVSKIGGDDYESEYLCILEKEDEDLVSVFNDFLQVLDQYDIVKEGDLRIEGNKLVEVPLICVDEIVGNETIFRLKYR